MIDAKKVAAMVKKIRNNSSPGPDGLTKRHIMSMDPTGTQLAMLYNAMLLQKYIPNCLKTSQTTLIPKSNDKSKLKELKNWRPISISPIIMRIFSGILTQRLSQACIPHWRQKGFIKSPGCAENLVILNGLTTISRRNGRPLAVIFIDLAKAFDTISHKLIQESLKQRGRDKLPRHFLRNSYIGCQPRVKTASGWTEPICLNIGVKQGEPSVPFAL